ncbi:FAD-dependent oxidoreductase [Candidatus Bathyarchaeota archaeon]|nr:FAD-dependent oxidoreductase [Candidatus Bathyarchaeota archaeon]
MKSIYEEKRKIDIVAEVDVVVAGGGPAGLAAATAAARCGAKTILVERYGYLGGLATGGLVICLVETDRYNYGLCQEFVDELSSMKAAKQNRASGETPKWTEGASFSGEESWTFDPQVFKFLADKFVSESGADMLLHSYVASAIVKGNEVNGIIVEGKSGRQAILGKVVVDTTGDADIAAGAGAPFNYDRHPWGIDLEYRVGNVDLERALKWRNENKASYEMLMKELGKDAATMGWGGDVNKGVVWCHGPHFYDVDGLNTKHLTKIEVESRKKIMETLEFYRKHVPGFEDAFVLEFAPQIGIRETRRIIGEYVLTKEDAVSGRRFDDAVASSLFDIPYRCLIPKTVDGLIVSGRCISTTHEAHGVIRNIPPCIITGQAAGTAAALASQKGVAPRKLDVRLLRETLAKQGFKLKK